MSYQLFRFLSDQYSVAEIQYFIKQRNENDKNNSFLMKNQEVYVNIG